MKTIKSLLLVAAIAFSSVLSASTPDEKAKAKSENTAITQAVEKLLQNPSFDVEKEMTAKVTLTINKDNEIVVLSVESEDESFEGFLKGRLNYQAVSDKVTAGPRSYVIPVRIKSEI